MILVSKTRKSQKMNKLNAKDALVRVQPDSIEMKSFKNKPKVVNVIHSLVRVSNKIIQVGFDYVFKIVKGESHGTLEGFSDVFKAERNFPVCKSTPRKNKCCLVLILGFDLNLIIS